MIVRLYHLIRYAFIFVWEVIVANVQVVRIVLSPTLRIRPGFLAVPMRAKTDLEVTSLANSITLTPGTIAVHVSDDRHDIVIHALDIGDDPDDVRRSIQTTLEANILNWTRGPGWEKDQPQDDAKQSNANQNENESKTGNEPPTENA